MRFSRIEVRDLILAWFVISLAFAILFSKGFELFSSFSLFFISFLISGFTVGIGFLFHEMMHKFTAQKYMAWAEFRAYYSWLSLAFLLSFFGFIIAAPGGVIIKGKLTREQYGKVSLAGPISNITLAITFLIPILLFSLNKTTELFFNYGFSINSFLALFNLLPFPPFDGQKIYSWNSFVYFTTVILAGGLFLLDYVFI